MDLHMTFAKTGYFSQGPSIPLRSSTELKYQLDQKKFDEQSSVAQSIIIAPRIKAKTQGRFGGPNLRLQSSAQFYNVDKSW